MARLGIFLCLLCTFVLLAVPFTAQARPPIRADFFTEYPGAVGSQLDALPSDSKHCGVCHFDFAGGGPRNPYGLGIEVGIGNGLSNSQAILAIEGNDSDGDGHTNLTEITNTVFTNTPTFPGLSSGNVGSTSNIPLNEITPYLTPMGSTDTTPPVVTVIAPNGSESINANTAYNVTYTATDGSGISHVHVSFSDDGGSTFKVVGLNQAPTGSFSWFVPNRPGSQSVIRVTAYDNAGNPGSDESNAGFTVNAAPPGVVPTTLRDIDMDGSQPLQGVVLADATSCYTCHEGYDAAVEPGANWEGSMMSQAMRDPLFLATMVIAEQDAPSAGDLCLRCHTPGGWMEGRSVDTSGGLVNAKDRQGIQCDYCHRLVDRNYVAGVSPPQDADLLAGLVPLPLQYGNGQHVADPSPIMRGPYDDADASHEFVESPFHRSSNICGTCHDVSNPVFMSVGPGDYAPTGFDAEHPTMDLRDMFPVERTFSEWSQSAYAATGVYAPQFAGTKPDGIVSTCQDCHMRDVSGKGCSEPGAPTRTDLPLHDFTGGNTFIPDILATFYPGEVNTTRLQAAKSRAISMIQLAATLEVTPEVYGIKVRVYNQTGHKLPSGYPEGRRIWINVVAEADTGVVFESGHYDFGTALLEHDNDPWLKIYEVHPGVSPGLAAALGAPAGPSFHFVLSDTIFADNRIPPRGFSNAAFAAVQAAPVAHTYLDGQYWDDSVYHLPLNATSVTVTLYYQSTSKEYITFLRDENVTNTLGDDLYAAWVAQGMAPPVVMADTTLPVSVSVTAVTEETRRPVFGLLPSTPNPFARETRIAYRVEADGPVRLEIFDISGRLVRSLVDQVQAANEYETAWDGRDRSGRGLSAGVYFLRLKAGGKTASQRIVLMH
jgi:hypothetical protein